jgi:predicted dehydrogenase
MIRVGLIGYGYWGPKLARCIASAADCQLRAICDLSAERLASAAPDHPAARLEQGWRMLVDDPWIDAIVIATPAASHFDFAKAALDAGKHVLVEKPMALSSEDASELMAKAERRNLVLMTDHTYVYSPALQAIRSLVSEGSLGRIRRFESLRVNAEGSRHDVDVLWDLAAHDLSILEFLFPASAQAVRVSEAEGPPGSPRARAVLSVYFPQSLIARIRVDWAAGTKQRQIEIVGTKGTLLFDDLQAVKLWRSGPAKAGAWAAPAAVTIAKGEPLAAIVDHFAACIRRREAALTCGEAGLRVIQLLEAASRSLARAGSLVPLDWGACSRPAAVR